MKKLKLCIFKYLEIKVRTYKNVHMQIKSKLANK